MASGAISEPEWNRLLKRIEDGKIIPVVGEQLSVIPTVGGDQSLADYLAAKLELPGPPTSSLNELAFRYLRQPARHIDDLYADISQALPSGEDFVLPTPLKQLAEIRGFQLFITTSFDPMLALPLNEVRFGRRASGSTRVLAYERNRAIDLPERYRELDYPIVYHLFGKAQAAPIYAVTDEDVLELVHTLQAPECQPPHLTDAIADQRLLVLGTRLTGWLTRFFLRLGSPDRLRDARRTDYVIDAADAAHPDQVLFFEHFSEARLLAMPAAAFIDELVQRWRARHPEHTPTTLPRPPSIASAERCDVFLSYASEDLAIVKTVRERLEREAGVRVWLDKDALRGGEQWDRHIVDALRSCALCVPVVSTHATTSGFRYVRTEWSEALRLQRGRPADQTFIVPLAIDDVRADDPALDPELRALHWRRLHDEADMQRFLAEIRAGVQRSQ
ncbi:MAG TPA: toll/interleukin-1 receptor domain-containing protein [Kofleriaceae bacterium]|nr:toll/interleukin-1 receptor domain-containing protein [Kofleriaceae bacterium]